MQKILVVDDEPKFLKALSLNFRRKIKEGEWQFEFAKNGQEALALAKKSPEISLIITDINMPEMDGLTLLERLKQVNPNLNAIVITGYNDTENMRRAFKTGVTDFIPKTTELNELQKSIESALAIKTIDVAATTVTETDETTTHPTERVATPRDRSLERKPVKKNMVTGLARRLPKRYLYDTVAEIIEDGFTPEDIERLQEELEELRLIAIEREKEKEQISDEDFKRSLRGEIPLSLLNKGHVEKRMRRVKNKNGTVREFGPYYYIRYYDKETGKLKSRYVGKTDPRISQTAPKLLNEAEVSIPNLQKESESLATNTAPSKKQITRKVLETTPSGKPRETDKKILPPTEKVKPLETATEKVRTSEATKPSETTVDTPDTKQTGRQNKKIDLTKIRLT